MQVEVDEMCMHTKFGGQGARPLFSGDFAPFKFGQIFHGGQKIESAHKIHASRD